MDSHSSPRTRDVDSVISWGSLLALGRSNVSAESLDDFADVDSALSLSNNDNVSSYWLDSGNPKLLDNFSVYYNLVYNVSVVNSSNSSSFQTGILWDGSDDVDDGEFDSVDAEDLVFVSKVSDDSSGKFGVYDYEVRVPATLEDYKAGSSSLVFYMELR